MTNPVAYPWANGLDPITHKPMPDYPEATVIPAHTDNYGAHRVPELVSAIVLHATVGSQAATVAWFRNPRSQVSAHYVVNRRGRVIQMVPESFVAWHAGSVFWNRVSIGIELVNRNDGQERYGLPQVTSLVRLLRDLVAQYGIERAWIVPHAQITPGKTDPRGFPLDAVLGEVYGERNDTNQ